MNYKKLLEKYMQYIKVQEGITFVYDTWDNLDGFTKKEHAILVEMSDRLFKEEGL